MDFRIFGPLEVTVDGQRIRLGGANAKLLASGLCPAAHLADTA